MKNLCVSVSLIMFFVPLQAQSKYFEKTVNINADIHSARAVKVTNDGNHFIVSGNMITLDIGEWYAYLAKIDLKGDTVWSRALSHNMYSQISNMLLSVNNGFAITGFTYPSPAVAVGGAYVQLFDENGEQVAFYAAGDSVYGTSAGSLLETGGGEYLLGGEIATTLPGSYRPYLTKLGADGTQLWRRQFNAGFFEHSSIRAMLPAPGGGACLLGNANLDWGGPGTGDIFLMLVDSMGTSLWDTLYNPGTVDQVTDAIRTADGGILIAGEMDEDTGIAMKLKPDFSVQWLAQGINDIGGTKGIVETGDGSFVMSGSTHPPGLNRNDLSLTKLGADGQLLWRRFYGKPDVSDYGYNMTATPDGGYIVCGRADTLIEAISTYYADVYLVKTNCMGLLTEPEAGFEYDAVDEFNIQFINQSQYVYTDSIDGGFYLWDFGDGSTSGEPHPQHSYPDAAEYQVTLTAVVCSDTSVYTRTVSTTPTGINPQARAGSITVLPPSPNPAAAGSPIRIGLEFPHFIANQTATVRLYDPNGRLLHEGRQTGSGHYALPTSGLPTGLYLYGVEWEGNVLARGKVAVF